VGGPPLVAPESRVVVEARPRRRARAQYSSPAHRRKLEAHVRASCESRAGTYRMLAENGNVLYVGKSRSLRARLLSYFRATGRGDRQARILRHAFRIEWDYAFNEFDALLTELRLIKRHRPHFNTAMVEDEWPRAYVAIARGPVPGLRMVRRTDDPRAEALWGPFRRVTQLADAMRALAEVTGVRDCALEDAVQSKGRRKLWFASDSAGEAGAASRDGKRTPGCLRVELGTCVGPCVGGGSAETYRDGVAMARAFLEASSNGPLKLARQRMRQAAEALEFERASIWRDKVERLAWLKGRLARFRANMDRLTFRYLVRGSDGGSRVYLIRRGTVRADLAAPTTEEESAALDALAERIYLGPDPKGGDVPTHDLDEFYLVASWFRRHPEELANTRPGASALATR
jgi:excinuclease ABC subunit C